MRIGGKMKKQRERINLSIDREVLELVKKWSYITQTPISRLFDEVFSDKLKQIGQMSPEEWLYGSSDDESPFDEEEMIRHFEEMQKDNDEEKYCRKHPNSPRARIRQARIKKLIEKVKKEAEEQHKEEEKFITRWREVFPDS